MVFAALTTEVVGLTDRGLFVIMLDTGDISPPFYSLSPFLYLLHSTP
jgi:hypothetical protein